MSNFEWFLVTVILVSCGYMVGTIARGIWRISRKKLVSRGTPESESK